MFFLGCGAVLFAVLGLTDERDAHRLRAAASAAAMAVAFVLVLFRRDS